MTMFVSSRNLPFTRIDPLAPFFDRLGDDRKIVLGNCPSKAGRYLAGYTGDYRSRQRTGKVQDLTLLFGRQPFELLAELSFDCSVHCTVSLRTGANSTQE